MTGYHKKTEFTFSESSDKMLPGAQQHPFPQSFKDQLHVKLFLKKILSIIVQVSLEIYILLLLFFSNIFNFEKIIHMVACICVL